MSIRTVTEVQDAAIQNSEKTPFSFNSISCGSVTTRKVERASGLCFHFSFLYCSPAPSTRCDLWFNEYFLRLVHVRHTVGTKICSRSSGPTSSKFTYLFYGEFFLFCGYYQPHLALLSGRRLCTVNHPSSILSAIHTGGICAILTVVTHNAWLMADPGKVCEPKIPLLFPRILRFAWKFSMLHDWFLTD